MKFIEGVYIYMAKSKFIATFTEILPIQKCFCTTFKISQINQNQTIKWYSISVKLYYISVKFTIDLLPPCAQNYSHLLFLQF